ncbi:putative T7SS-secreted protein [Microbacterium sp. MMO-113]|uniref:putative T7SS-secreted protein n=1 Tax=Microbacterium sp. MMO-113 TaxID=3081273 RepID=UPI00301A7967
MTVHWTDRDPGAGDTAAFATAIAWADAQLVDLANAQDVVSTILRDLDDAWSGRAADAFRTRLEDFHSRLDDSTDAMTTARKSIITYRDAVAEISRLAEPLKEELAASQAALSGVMNDASFGGEPGDRFAAEQEARAAASTAATALKKLAVDRQAADSDLAVSLATAASLGWGDLDCTTDPVPGTRRDATNDRVMDLFEHFRTGDERGAVLTDNDIFVQTLMRSTTSPQPGSKYSTSCEAESSRRWLRVLTIDRSVISRWCWAPTGSTLCLAR